MKNYQINSIQLVDLVALANSIFQFSNNNINHVDFKSKAKHMHYVADLFKNLVSTAYPLKEEKSPRSYKIHIPVDEHEKAMAEEMAGEIIKAIKMAEEQYFRDGDF